MRDCNRTRTQNARRCSRPWRLGDATLTGVALAAVLLGGCASSRVLRPFTSDGCSLFPDGDTEDSLRWADCCRTHDMAYWRGGTAHERRNADVALRDCVLARTGRPTLAAWMYRGVRIGGLPLFPTGFRWGYGWGYGRGYAPLAPDEQQRADELLAPYLVNLHEPSCERP